jgi:hypothetical protein
VASSMLSSWPLSLGTQTTKHTAAPVQTDPDVLAAVVVSVHSGLPQRDVVSTPKHPFGTHAGRRPHPFIASTGSSSLRRDVVPGRPMPGQRAAGGLMVDRLGGRLRGLGRLLGQGPAQVTGGPSTRWRGRSGGSRASSRSYSGGQDMTRRAFANGSRCPRYGEPGPSPPLCPPLRFHSGFWMSACAPVTAVDPRSSSCGYSEPRRRPCS